jgi:long-chain fatty acid transport protein
VTDYPSDWVGRYQALYSSLTTYNIQPTVAWKVNPNLSVGAGLQIQYAEAELSQAIDFASIIDASTGAVVYAPGSVTGVGTVKGSDWSLGYTLGALYKFNQDTRIGASFRSEVNHTLTGDATTTGVPSVSTLIALFQSTGASAALTTPAVASAGVYHQFDKRWAVMGDVSWTNWSSFKTLTVDYDNALRSDTVTEENWKDSWFVSLGVSYKPADQWTLRAGVAYDQSPVPDVYRTPRIPDSDRYWLSVGVAYDLSQTVQIAAAYTHIFAEDATVSLTDDLTGSTAFRSSLSGVYSNSVDILSMQVKVTF